MIKELNYSSLSSITDAMVEYLAHLRCVQEDWRSNNDPSTFTQCCKWRATLQPK